MKLPHLLTARFPSLSTVEIACVDEQGHVARLERANERVAEARRIQKRTGYGAALVKVTQERDQIADTYVLDAALVGVRVYDRSAVEAYKQWRVDHRERVIGLREAAYQMLPRLVLACLFVLLLALVFVSGTTFWCVLGGLGVCIVAVVGVTILGEPVAVRWREVKLADYVEAVPRDALWLAERIGSRLGKKCEFVVHQLIEVQSQRDIDPFLEARYGSARRFIFMWSEAGFDDSGAVIGPGGEVKA